MTAPASPLSNTPVRLSAYIGFALFLAGMAMIYYVFARANTLLTAPPPPVPQVVGVDPNGATNAGLALGASVTALIKQLLILLVMCVAGSVFASQGIRMLFAAWNTKE